MLKPSHCLLLLLCSAALGAEAAMGSDDCSSLVLGGARKAILYASMPFGTAGDAMRMILNDPAVSNINAFSLKKAKKLFPILEDSVEAGSAPFQFYELDRFSPQLRAQQLLTLQNGEEVRLVTKDGNQITGRIVESDHPRNPQKQVSLWTDLSLENKNPSKNGYEIQVRWEEIAAVGRDPQKHVIAVKKLLAQEESPYRSMHVSHGEKHPADALYLGQRYNIIEADPARILFSVNNRDAYFSYGQITTIDLKTGRAKVKIPLGKKEELIDLFPSGWVLTKTQSSPCPYTHTVKTSLKTYKDTRYFHLWDLWSYNLNTGKRRHLESVHFEHGAEKVGPYDFWDFEQARKRWEKTYRDQAPEEWPVSRWFTVEDIRRVTFSRNKKIKILPQNGGVKSIRKNGLEIGLIAGCFLCFSANDKFALFYDGANKIKVFNATNSQLQTLDLGSAGLQLGPDDFLALIPAENGVDYMMRIVDKGRGGAVKAGVLRIFQTQPW